MDLEKDKKTNDASNSFLKSFNQNMESFLPKFLLSDLNEKEFNEQNSYENFEKNFSKIELFEQSKDMNSFLEQGNSSLDKVINIF